MTRDAFKLTLLLGCALVFFFALGVYAGRDTVPVRVVRVPVNQRCVESATIGEVICYVSEVKND